MEKSLYPEDMWIELYELYPNDFPEPTPSQLLDFEANKIRERYAIMMDAAAKPYVKTEQLTWDIQVKEAELFLQDNYADTPFLNTLIKNRDISLNEISSRIINNSNIYLEKISAILNQQQKELDKLYGK